MSDQLISLNTIFTELYYWIALIVMLLIPMGFCIFVSGMSRRKNILHTFMNNLMLFPILALTTFLFGWWIYFGFANGPGIQGGFGSAPFASPWNELMGLYIGEDEAGRSRINGVTWAVYGLFSCTVATIVAGAMMERIRAGALWMLGVLIGSVFWSIGAGWGWSPNGWMVNLLGFHDAYAAGVVHTVAGGFALGVLRSLGPRLGRYSENIVLDLPPDNRWLASIGQLLMIIGFLGFYMACNTPMVDVQSSEGQFFSATNVYGAPVTLSGTAFNFILSLSAGLLMGYIVSGGNALWTLSGGLAGVIGTSAGNDIYHPLQAFLLAAFVTWIVYRMHKWLESKFQLDDVTAAVSVHGFAGWFSLVIAGIVLWGYPSSPSEDAVIINPLGQFIGAIILFWVIGFIPGRLASRFLEFMGVLRIRPQVEIAGLDTLQDEKDEQDKQLVIDHELRELQELLEERG